MKKNFFKDAAVYLIPTVISRGMSIFLIPLYTRALSPDDYGTLDLILVTCSLVNISIGLEIPQGLARIYAETNDEVEKKVICSTAFSFFAGIYLSFVAVCILFLPSIVKLANSQLSGKSTITVATTLLAIFYIFSNGMFNFFQNLLRWKLQSRKYTYSSTLSAATTASVALILLFYLDMGLDGLLIGMLAGMSAACLYSIWDLKADIFYSRFSRLYLKSMLSFSLPLVPSGLAIFATQYIDRILLNQYLSLYHVGIYGVAYRISSSIDIIMTGFRLALSPLVYRHHEKPEAKKDLATLFRYFFALALLGYAITTIFSREILTIFAANEYQQASKLLPILIPAILFSNMYIFAPGMAIQRKTRIMLLISLTTAGIAVVGNWIFIPAMETEGAAIAKLVAYSSSFLLYMAFSQRFFKVHHNWGPLFAGTTAVTAIIFGIPVFADTTVWQGKVLQVSLVVPALFLSRMLRWTELTLGAQHLWKSVAAKV